jgi:WD40 repeat protein
MSRIFLSHASQDAREAVALKQWLAEQDPPLANEIFLDLDRDTGIKTGVRWKDALLRANSRCEAVVCLLSANWGQSDECRIEYRTAENLYKQIFCARLEPSADDYLTADWQRCDLFGSGPTVAIDIGDGRPVEFDSNGLIRLRDGIRGAGIGAESFVWPPRGRPDRAPYRGWEPFEEDDAGVFFGRDAQIVLALDALRGMRRSETRTLFVVLGPSGTGKSSFLRAGLLPRLRREDRRFLLFDSVRPERNALTGASGLASAIHATRTRLGLKAPALGDVKAACLSGVAAVRQLLIECQRVAYTRLLDDSTDGQLPTLVLPLDQAEELFTADAGPQAPQFLSLLADIAGDNDRTGLGLIVAATIRTDRYEAMQTAPELANLDTHVFDDLKPMPTTQFKEVITGPAARATESGRPVKLEPKLVTRLLTDCSEGADTLPLLSLTLARLFADFGSGGELTLARYEAMGGIAHVVQTEVDSLLARDPGQRKDQLDRLQAAFIPWLATINPENDQPMRRVARWADIPEDSLELIDGFVDKRLMIKDERDGEVVVEVALESLLRQWEDLAGWLRAQRDDLKHADDIERGAAAWKRNNRDDAWLLTGTRLTDAETLAVTTGFHERLWSARDYLEASRQRENALQEAERQRQEIEIRTAREHAASLRKRARVLQALVAVAVVVAVLAAVGFVQANRANDRAQTGFRDATALRLSSESSAMLSYYRPGGDVRALQQLIAAYQLSPEVAAGPLFDAEGDRFTTRKIIPTPKARASVAVSRDSGRIASGGWDNAVYMWDSATGQPVRTPLTGHDGVVNTVAFSPDGQTLASGSFDGSVRLWNLQTGELRVPPIVGVRPSQLAYSPDGRILVAGTYNGTLQRFNAATGAAMGVPMSGHGEEVRAVAFRSDGRVIASGGADGTIRLWNADTGVAVGEPIGGPNPKAINAIAYRPDGLAIASGQADGYIDIYDVRTGEQAGFQSSLADTKGVTSLAFSPDGRRLVSGGQSGGVSLWSVASPLPGPWNEDFGPAMSRFGPVLTGHFTRVGSVGYAPDGRWVVSAGKDGTVREWSIGVGSPMYSSLQPLSSVALSPDGRRIAAAGENQVQVWNVELAKTVGEVMDTGTQNAVAVTFVTAGRFAAAAGDSVQVGDIDDGRIVGPPLRGKAGVLIRAVACSPDGRTIAAGGTDGSVWLWDTETWSLRGAPLTASTTSVLSLAFSPDGGRVAVGAADKSVRVWSVETGEPTTPVMEGHSGEVTAVAFAPDGDRVVSASRDDTLLMWNADTGEPIGGPMTGPINDLLTVAFSPDGQRLASGGADNTVWLWNASSRTPIGLPIVGQLDDIVGLAFSPDGNLLLVGDRSGTMRMRPGRPDEAALCDRLTTNMSHQQWRDWVSPDFEYVETCPGLPIAADVASSP